MIAGGLELARRLEAAEVRIGAACAVAHQNLNPTLGAAVLEIGDASAIFVGAESPLTHVVGLGLSGPVRADMLDRIEAFYRQRGAPVHVDLCPLADASLIELLGRRGYRLMEFNTVLVRELPSEIPATLPVARMADATEEQLWAYTVGCGFLEKDALTPDEMDVGRAIWHMPEPESRRYLAYNNGHPSAAAALAVHQGLATLFADSTIQAFRGTGLHAALIRERLRAAAAENCDLATASAMPGSISQRNYQRHGFGVAYTKAVLVR